jgi:hypothetical protein
MRVQELVLRDAPPRLKAKLWYDRAWQADALRV